MASYTITADMTLEAAIVAGSLVNGDEIIVTNGATCTILQTPSILLAYMTINNGKLKIDGKNIAAGNSITIPWRAERHIAINGPSELIIDGDWFDVGTTDGTDSQEIDLSSTGADYWNGDKFIDAVPMIQIETGRRIYFDNESGILPEVDDFVKKTSDVEIIGRIVEVNSANSYLVVKYLTGTLVDDDDIFVEKIVDRNGPSMERSWTAKVNNSSGDIKESGIYQIFANCIANDTSYIDYFHHGIGGFVFENKLHTSTITLGSSAGLTGGFVPPSGCNIRIPNIHFSTTTPTLFLTEETISYSDDGWNSITAWINCGALIITHAAIFNCGVFIFSTNGSGNYISDAGFFVAASFGEASGNLTIERCTFSEDPYGTYGDYGYGNGLVLSSVKLNNSLVSECYFCSPLMSWSSKLRIQNMRNVTLLNNTVTKTFVSGTIPWSEEHFVVYNTTNLLMDGNIVVLEYPLANGATRFLDIASCNDGIIRNTYLYSTHSGTPLEASSEEGGCVAFTSCNDLYVCGISVLGGSGIRGTFISPGSCVGLKIRCIGTISNYAALGNCSRLFMAYGYNIDLDFSRIFVTPPIITSSQIYLPNRVNSVYRNLLCGFTTNVYNHGAPSGAKFLAEGLSCVNNDGFLLSTIGYMVHDIYKSETVGSLLVTFSFSYEENVLEVISGNPIFSGDGRVTMSAGDEFIVYQTYFMRGHEAFTGEIIENKYYNSPGWPNVAVEFQYDVGEGYNGTWLNLTSGALTSITDIETGIKFKFKLTATGPQYDMTSLELITAYSNQSILDNLYPIDQDYVTVKLTTKDIVDYSLLEGVRIRIRADIGGPLPEGTTILTGVTNSSGAIQTTEFLYSEPQPVVIDARRASGVPYYQPAILTGTITDVGLDLTALLIRD